jgi:hypothetical protein
VSGARSAPPGQVTVPVSWSMLTRSKPLGVRASANTGPCMRLRTSSSPLVPSAKASARTRCRSAVTLVMSGVRPINAVARSHGVSHPPVRDASCRQARPGAVRPHASTNRSWRLPSVLSITSSVSICTFASPSEWRAWKCGGSWSSKYIAITIPKKRQMVGTPGAWCPRRWSPSAFGESHLQGRRHARRHQVGTFRWTPRAGELAPPGMRAPARRRRDDCVSPFASVTPRWRAPSGEPSGSTGARCGRRSRAQRSRCAGRKVTHPARGRFVRPGPDPRLIYALEHDRAHVEPAEPRAPADKDLVARAPPAAHHLDRVAVVAGDHREVSAGDDAADLFRDRPETPPPTLWSVPPAWPRASGPPAPPPAHAVRRPLGPPSDRIGTPSARQPRGSAIRRAVIPTSLGSAHSDALEGNREVPVPQVDTFDARANRVDPVAVQVRDELERTLPDRRRSFV